MFTSSGPEKSLFDTEGYFSNLELPNGYYLLQTPETENKIHVETKKDFNNTVRASIREVTAYNVGDPKQNYGDPCIAANGENICTALKLGLKILYLPYAMVRHPDASSGRALRHNPDLLKAKGGMFYRIFGWKAYGVCVLFALKKQRETGYSLVKNIRLMYAGIEEFKALDHG